MNFNFFTPTRVIFGRGRMAELGPSAASLGRHALLVTGRASAGSSGLQTELSNLLARAGVEVTHFSVAGEPSVETVDHAAELARNTGCDLVVAVGGGSCLDTGKAAALLAANDGSALDYLEVIGRGLKPERPGLPTIAMPTTGGTGAEATRNAVLGHGPSRRKVSFRHEYLMPRVALVDPALTDSLPPPLTASSGMDALTQLIEALFSRAANPLTDALALDGIRRASHALPIAYGIEAGDVATARDNLSLAALESGICLGSAGLGIVHGLSGPLGGRFPVPHGFACAALLPHAFSANVHTLIDRGRSEPALRKLTPLAVVMGIDVTNKDISGAAAAVTERLNKLVRLLRVPRLREFGVTRESLPALAREGLFSSSTRYNPIDFSAEDLEEILTAAL